jgi:signal transduction histidine kinase
VTLARGAFPGQPRLERLGGQLSLAGLVALVALGLVVRSGKDPAQLAAGAAIAVAAATALFLLRLRPVIVYAAAATAGVAVLGNADSSTIVWFALVLVAVWCVLAGGVWVGGVYWAGAVLLFGGEWLWVKREPGWAPWIAGVTISVIGALFIRHQLVLLERLHAAQADLAERSRVEERSRIARELHDVIAHSLTVSLLHVTSARLAVEHDPTDAGEALAEAERLGRQALDEVRATMGLLQSDGGEGLAPPVPGLGQLPVLAEEYRRAGVPVCISVEADLPPIAETVGSTTYRIVQEALTNATKHAPGAAITARIERTGDVLKVCVDSAGPPRQGSGMGLANMADRARAVGGSCTAGPGGNGWLVTATLPCRTEGSSTR